MNRALTTLLASALTFGAVVATPAKAETKVGFIYVGPPGDLGWTYRHDIGRQAVEALDGFTTTALENVPEGPEAVEAITQLAETGHDLIFTTSFGFMDATNEVAGNYPDVKFEHATGYIRAHENVSTYSGRFYEGRVVQGYIAANITESNKIGYIASFPIPEVIRGINAFMLEAKKHNPDVEVEIVWVFTWFDPAKEAAAAQALIDNGADIIAAHTDSPAPMQIAEANGAKAYGQASNMSRFGETAHLVSTVDDWDSYYVERAIAVANGTWESQDSWWGFTKDGMGGEVGMVHLADYSNMPADIMAEAKAIEAALAAGDRHSFPCPIYMQDGNLAEDCANGEAHLTDGTLLGMNWYIEGIDGTIPQ